MELKDKSGNIYISPEEAAKLAKLKSACQDVRKSISITWRKVDELDKLLTTLSGVEKNAV